MKADIFSLKENIKQINNKEVNINEMRDVL